MSRIASAFEGARRGRHGVLVAYLMAGDPNLKASEPYVLACERGGAGVLELGMPFSDPIADGPEIQGAAHRAIAAGTTIPRVFDLVRRIRRISEMPLVLMGYYNPIFAMGDQAFAERASSAGADGIVVPDLPPEEADSLRNACRDAALDLPFLVSPATSRDRARMIAERASGFVYLVSRYGITGASDHLPDHLADRIAEIGKVSKLPVAVGFGLSSPEQVRAVVRAGADGAIVGSAIVREIASGTPPARLESFIRRLSSAV